MKPESKDYEILFWMKNFGYSQVVIHASDVYEAVVALRNSLADKYGDIVGKVLITKVEEK